MFGDLNMMDNTEILTILLDSIDMQNKFPWSVNIIYEKIIQHHITH